MTDKTEIKRVDDKESNGVDLSVIIVSYNTRDLLEDGLRSIYDNPPSVSYEVFVVDNDSDDGSYEMVREKFPQARAIAFERNLGFVMANNHAIRDSQGRYTLLLNSDTKVKPGSLQRMVEFMDSHPETGVMGCKQLNRNKELQLTWGKFPSFRSEIIRKVMQKRLEIDGTSVREYLNNKFNGKAEIDWVSGSCMMVRRDAFRDAGLLDENFFMYFEDIDWCYRMSKKNWKVYYNPDIEIIHYGGESANKNKLVALLEYRKSQFYFCRKYFGRLRFWLLRVLICGKAACHFLLWFVRYIFNYRKGESRDKTFAMLLIYKKMFQLSFKKVDIPREH